MAIPTERQAKIVDWLHEDNSLTIKVLAERLDVSLMTVHRDLDKLTREGIVRKVHGGVMLAPQAMQTNALENRCQLCRGRVPNRTAFTLTTKAGERADACCPHCGLMLLQQIEEVSSALTVDYLFLTSKSHTSTSSSSAIRKSTSTGGCISLVHQREIVDRSLPTSLASHLAVFPLSASTAFIRLYLRMKWELLVCQR